MSLIRTGRTAARRALRTLRPGSPPDHFAWAATLTRDPGWRRALRAATGGPRVLVASSMGGFRHLGLFEGVVAAALTLRGAATETLLCDEALPACQMALSTREGGAARLLAAGPDCGGCLASGVDGLDVLGLPSGRYSWALTSADRGRAAKRAGELRTEAIPDYREDGVGVGEHALAGALRFFARGDLSAEPQGEAVLRRYFEAALLTVAATRRLLAGGRYECVFLNHGIYVPQGLIAEVARREGVRVVTWNPAYRKRCFILSHGETYHHSLLTETTSHWEEAPWTEEMDRQIVAYLESRWHGSRDWIWFHEKPQEELSRIAAEVGVDFDRPCVGLLTNVIWDAQLHYRANAFGNMLEWLVATVRHFAGRPDLQLLIRVHPAEVRGTVPSRQPVVEELRRAFPQLPPNVFVIPPESQVSTYAAMLQCDSVLIYGTKTGVELTSMGVPVVVAGEAWIRNKGITLDASTPEEYFALLDGLPLRRRLDEAAIARARRYAYHFFFRRMVPVGFINPQPGWPPYCAEPGALTDLAPGGDPGLEVICDGILRGTEFLFPAERYPELAYA